jgi:hypothetical protein
MVGRKQHRKREQGGEGEVAGVTSTTSRESRPRSLVKWAVGDTYI